MSHAFNFEGGEILCKMGASWFVSYAYCEYIDINHLNWQLIETVNYRIKVFDDSVAYHKFWLNEILKMNNKRLNTNEIRVDAVETKKMARKLLDIVYS